MKADVIKMHQVWHKFEAWLIKSFGPDLYGKEQSFEVTNHKTGKKRKVTFKPYNDLALHHKLIGYEVITKIEKYAIKNPNIKIVRCDDMYYSGSIIVLIPHPQHGITMMFIPQTTKIQNCFFLYQSHYKQLMQTLKEMRNIFKQSKQKIK